jgi:hypothetical protein
VFFAQVLVVHFVRFANRHEINVFRSTEPFEALVNEDIVDQEIGQSVEGNTGSNPHPKITSGQ